jgi:Mg-chelatase subunit ChlD
MIFAMSIFRNVLDRLLTAPGEMPGQGLAVRSNSTKAVRPPADSAGKSVTTASKPRPKPEPSAFPPTVYLLLDISGSMDEAKLRQARDGGASFAEDAIGKGYSVGVIQFSLWASLRVEPTKDKLAIKRGLSEVGLQLTTNMAAAIELATEQFGRKHGLRAMVLVTDGYPTDAEAALRAAAEAKRRDITIIAIGTDDADRNFLKKLASATRLATTVADRDLGVAIAKAAGLLPAKTSGSR